MIKKYLKKHIYLDKKDKKLLMNRDQNGIIMEYEKIHKKIQRHLQMRMIKKFQNIFRRNTKRYW